MQTQDKHTFMSKRQFKENNYPNHHFFGLTGSLSNRKHLNTCGKHPNSLQKDPKPGLEPKTFLLQANTATVTPTTNLSMLFMFRLWERAGLPGEKSPNRKQKDDLNSKQKVPG